MVRDPGSGKYRRARLFVLTLGYSRKSVRLLVMRSSTRVWAELHERAFRRLGAVPKVIVLDNLREGVLAPDIYDPTLNPLYRDCLAHYGVVALPCRVRDPDRKGKVESSDRPHPADAAQGPSLRDARGGAGVSRTAGRPTGPTPASTAPPSAKWRRCLPKRSRCCERSRSSPSVSTSTATAPCTSTDTSRWRAPTTPCRPVTSAEVLWVQWDDYQRADPRSEERSCSFASTCDTERETTAPQDEDRPPRMPRGTQDLLFARRASGQTHRRRWPRRSTAARSEHGVRRILGVLVARPQVRSPCRRRCLRRGDRARRADLPLRAPLPRAPSARAAPAATNRSADPRAHPLPKRHQPSHPGGGMMNLVELQRSLRQLRLGGMAHALEPRILEAQSSQIAPIDFLSTLVSDELTVRADRLLQRRIKHARVSRAGQDPRRLRLRLQQEDESPPRLRARHRPIRRSA